MSQTLSSSLFRPEILAMSAYKVADASGLIKLDAMENPFNWPDDLKKEWLDHLKTAELNRYPDPEASELVSILRKDNQLPDTSAVILGNGSDEIIQILLMALKPGSTVLAPEPCFVMYKQIARSLDLPFVGFPLLQKDFSLDEEALINAIEQHQPALIFLAYPNNPTGNLFDRTTLTRIIQSTKGLVVIDEAYAPFAKSSFIEELDQYPNLLVMRTVSKLGLAGLRLGFLAGNPALLEELNKIRLPYNINILTQATASFALKHSQFLYQQTDEICQQRSRVFEALNQIENIEAYPSFANFILFKSLTKSADHIFTSLKKQGVLIKNLSPQGGLLDQCLRVTIGSDTENMAFLRALNHTLTDT